MNRIIVQASSMKELHAKIRAFKVLFHLAPEVQTLGTIMCTDGELAFISSPVRVRVGRVLLTLELSNGTETQARLDSTMTFYLFKQ